jgi:hypothetical protein
MLFDFNGKLESTAEEQEQLFKELVTKALENKEHAKFEYIKNITEFFVVRKCCKALRKVIKVFQSIADSLYKNYCQQVGEDQQDFNLLFVYTQYKLCIQYYTKELEIALDMLDEYDVYVGKGHFLDQVLFFKTREYCELWDHRKGATYDMF